MGRQPMVTPWGHCRMLLLLTAGGVSTAAASGCRVCCVMPCRVCCIVLGVQRSKAHALLEQLLLFELA